MREGEPHQDHTSRRIDRAWLGGSLLLVAFGLFSAASIGIPIAVGGLVLLIIKCPRGLLADTLDEHDGDSLDEHDIGRRGGLGDDPTSNGGM